MQVFFCDSCSRRVTEGELAEGEGVRIGDLAFCRFCCERPEVQEVLERASEMMEAGQARSVGSARRPGDAASESGLHRLVRGRRNGGHRTPHHGHRRVKAKTPPRGKPATPRPLRPVSPVPAGRKLHSRVDNFVRTTRNGVALAAAGKHQVYPPGRARRKGGGLTAFYVVAGVAAGFAIVAAASALTNRPAAGPRAPRRAREVSVRWAVPEATADGGVRFEGKCTLARAEGRGSPQALCWVGFPSGGPWSVRVNGRVAYHDVALDGSRAKVGPAAQWLHPGTNRIVATCGSGSVEDPPRLFVVRGR